MGRHRRPSSSAGSAAQGRARPGETGATEQYRPDGPPPDAAARRAPRGTPPGRGPVPSPLAPKGVRGDGHPEQREPGGGWGLPPHGPPDAAGGREMPGPRQEYLDAFEDEDLFAPGAPRRSPVQVTGEHGGRAPGATAYAPGGFFPPEEPPAAVSEADGRDGGDGGADGGEPTAPGRRRPGRGWAAAGAGAAAVVTVLAVVVGGQLLGGQDDGADSRSASDNSGRAAEGTASRSEGRPTPASPAPAPKSARLTYAQLMDQKVPLDPELTADGDFAAVPGIDKAPGKGQLFRYRVDVEKGLGLDAELFAEAVRKTLNDDRSWAHDGARTFERISTGRPDFVITLASPGTTAEWCAKSGLDTTVDNVSCDSASTDRVMINAYRWAQGAETYGDAMHAYRQMLINHEIGHRLGFNHVNCSRDGALAPVMQQQTKFLSLDGITCEANPWAYPN
ncbi:DUF3152 domain-containing protein [Streptomyces diastaticus]|uniref:DUF3152 domain-containing protein n=1 Tax=Streptomyces diastaticus TaxID=1956 RepID=UPI0033E0D6C3